MVASMALLEAYFFLLSILSLILALLLGQFLWVCYLNSVIIFFMALIIIWAIPLNLRWSRNLYWNLLKKIISFIVFSISIYAIEFWKLGIYDSKGEIVHSFFDSIYFSVTTWTTLGYGDFSPIPSARILTSLEALTGLLTIPLTASMVWLYCQERMGKSSIDDEQFVDGLKISADEITGLWKELESPKTIEEQNQRDIKFPLHPCSNCGSNDVKIEKYFAIYSMMTPQPLYIAHCGCGNQIKPFYTAYQVYWKWNRKNKITTG